MRFLFTQNIISFVPRGVAVSRRTKKVFRLEFAWGQNVLFFSYHPPPSSPMPKPFSARLYTTRFAERCHEWEVSPVAIATSHFTSDRQHILQCRTKKVEQNEAEVLRWEEARSFILESQKQLLFGDWSTQPYITSRFPRFYLTLYLQEYVAVWN